MKINITEEERKDLENILELLQSSSIEHMKLGISLIKKYKRFKNMIFTYDFNFPENTYIPRKINSSVNEDTYAKPDIYYFRFNSIYRTNIESVSTRIVRGLIFFITALFRNDDSFYKG